jgi:hypothetical protein
MSISLKTLSIIIDEISESIKNSSVNYGEETKMEINEIIMDFNDKLFSKVISFNSKDFYYNVDLKNMTCSCPHYKLRLANIDEVCKHISRAVKEKKKYEKWFYSQ